MTIRGKHVCGVLVLGIAGYFYYESFIKLGWFGL